MEVSEQMEWEEIQERRENGKGPFHAKSDTF